MSFSKKDYQYKKEFEKIIVKQIEKIGALLEKIDEIAKSLRFYALLMKWEDDKESIHNIFSNSRNLGKDYRIWYDHTLYRLQQGDQIVKLNDELIKKIEEKEIKLNIQY